jgi:hypothetical protein
MPNNDERCGKWGAEIDPIRQVDFTLKEGTKDERELRSFAKLFSRMDEKNRGLVFYRASKMAKRA